MAILDGWCKESEPMSWRGALRKPQYLGKASTTLCITSKGTSRNALECVSTIPTPFASFSVWESHRWVGAPTISNWWWMLAFATSTLRVVARWVRLTSTTAPMTTKKTFLGWPSKSLSSISFNTILHIGHTWVEGSFIPKGDPRVQQGPSPHAQTPGIHMYHML